MTTMTNGSARRKQAANGNVVLKVVYKGGEQEVLVGPVSLLEPSPPAEALGRRFSIEDFCNFPFRAVFSA